MNMRKGILSLSGVAIVLGTGCVTALAGTVAGTATTSSATSPSVNLSQTSGTGSSTSTNLGVKLTQQDAINIINKAFPDLAKLPGVSLNASLQPDPFMAGHQIYQLTWNPVASQPGAGGPNLAQTFILASVDANTGQITQFQRQTADWTLTTPISAEAAAAKAKTILAQLAPNYANQMVLQPAPSGNNGLSFLFVRAVNGVIAPFDQAQVGLSPDGQLVYYRFTWIPATIPSMPTHTIDTATATTDFMQALHMHLSYQQQYTRSGPGPMQLVYTPSPSTPAPLVTGIPSIDALTGQPLGADGKPIQATSSGTAAKLGPLVPGGPVHYPTRLTEPLTQMQVEQAARKMLDLSTQDWTVSGGGQGSIASASGNDETLMVSFTNTKSNENISLGMDTSTGVVTSYNANSVMVPGATTVTSTSSASSSSTGTTTASTASSSGGTKASPTSQKASVDAVADAFVEKMFPNLTGAIVRMPSTNAPQYGGPGINPSQGVQYSFLVHGIPVNGFSVFVDPTTGKVVSFNLFQDPTSLPNLPNPSGAISASAARNAFLKRNPLVLQYMLPETTASSSRPLPSKYSSTAKLVYAPTPMASGTGTLDAITGDWIPSASFGIQMPTVLPNNPTQQEKAIALLESHGITNATSTTAPGTINPSTPMTRIQFEQWLTRAYGVTYGANTQLNFSDIPANSPYQKDLLQGVLEGWLPNSGAFRPSAPLTRLQAADWLVAWMGWAPVAAHAQYFKIPFADASAIPTADQGAATIAADSGMIPLQSGAFNPNGTMTMGQAAVAMVSAVQTLLSSTNTATGTN
ncbi:YcdB/YcdC domain-containing protein [Alicyclobacillus mengziensis]|uniref:YcdB/YcdC repeated domain-containing protein n=1 Tax=Alicyclobacillus mengziensis TaxID=2931921 RepID=A0A9X7VZR6_9BACL|nr:YcdB/YcdC domain-containing protein [Alicyclobacillus mengziensis]QSO47547.1 hypothetical protein JZ786_00295 [Alicyclobacillus mengziensis]